MILTFKTLSNKQQTISVDENSPIGNLEKELIKLFDLNSENPIKFIYGGRQIKPETLIKDLNYHEGNFVIVTQAAAKKTTPPANKPQQPVSTSQPATPAPVSPAPTRPAPPPTQNTTISQPPASTPPQSPTANMTDEEFIQYSIEHLPNKESFEDNLTNLLALGYDRETCVRALIQSSNSPVVASNLLMDNKVKTINQLKTGGSSAHAPQTRTQAPDRPRNPNAPNPRDLFRESHDVPGMNPDFIIKSDIVPPTLGNNIPTMNYELIVTPMFAEQVNKTGQSRQSLHVLVSRFPNPEIIFQFPQLADHANNPGLALASLGLIKGNNGQYVRSLNIPSSEIFQIIPQDYTDEDYQNVLELASRNIPLPTVVQLYEACNRNRDQALYLLMQGN